MKKPNYSLLAAAFIVAVIAFVAVFVAKAHAADVYAVGSVGTTFHETKTTNATHIASAGAGLRLADFRFEGTLEGAKLADKMSAGSLNTVSVLGSAYYDVNAAKLFGITPYVGVHYGVVSASGSVAVDDYGTVKGVSAGVSLPVRDDLSVGIGYRHLESDLGIKSNSGTRDLTQNAVLATTRIRF